MTRRWEEGCAPMDDSQNVSSTYSSTVFSNVLVLYMFIYGKTASLSPHGLTYVKYFSVKRIKFEVIERKYRSIEAEKASFVMFSHHSLTLSSWCS